MRTVRADSKGVNHRPSGPIKKCLEGTSRAFVIEMCEALIRVRASRGIRDIVKSPCGAGTGLDSRGSSQS